MVLGLNSKEKKLVFILFDKKILHAKMIRKNICLELDKKIYPNWINVFIRLLMITK